MSFRRSSRWSPSEGRRARSPTIFPSTARSAAASRCASRGWWRGAAPAGERLKHFVARDGFDIEGLGAKHIRSFWEDGLIRRPGDIFRLNPAIIAEREGWGAVSAAKLVAAIDERRQIALDRFINALGIPQVGQATARLLARHYHSLARWRAEMEAAQDAESEARAGLVEIHGIGADMAADISGFFAEPHNRAVLD